MPMNDDGKIDFSSIDPTLDRVRFERLVRATAARALGTHPADTGSLLLRWWRPTLLATLSVAATVWGIALTHPATTATTRTPDPAETLLVWAAQGTPESTAEILDTFGGTR